MSTARARINISSIHFRMQLQLAVVVDTEHIMDYNLRRSNFYYYCGYYQRRKHLLSMY